MAELTHDERVQRMERLQAESNRRPRPADFICEAVAGAVADAVATGELVERLRQAGWALVHVGDHTCPEPPHTWVEEALNLMDPGWIDPLGLVTQLWRTAWTAGHQVGVDEAVNRTT